MKLISLINTMRKNGVIESYLVYDGTEIAEMTTEEICTALKNKQVYSPRLSASHRNTLHIYPELEFPLKTYIKKFLAEANKIAVELGGCTGLVDSEEGTVRLVAFFPAKGVSVIYTITDDERYYVQTALSPMASVPYFSLEYIRTTDDFPLYHLPERVVFLVNDFRRVCQQPHYVASQGRKVLIYK